MCSDCSENHFFVKGRKGFPPSVHLCADTYTAVPTLSNDIWLRWSPPAVWLLPDSVKTRLRNAPATWTRYLRYFHPSFSYFLPQLCLESAQHCSATKHLRFMNPTIRWHFKSSCGGVCIKKFSNFKYFIPGLALSWCRGCQFSCPLNLKGLLIEQISTHPCHNTGDKVIGPYTQYWAEGYHPSPKAEFRWLHDTLAWAQYCTRQSIDIPSPPWQHMPTYQPKDAARPLRCETAIVIDGLKIARAAAARGTLPDLNMT